MLTPPRGSPADLGMLWGLTGRPVCLPGHVPLPAVLLPVRGMSIAASEGKLGFGDDDSAALPPSGRVALPESDPELTAMLSQATESVRMH